MAPYGRPTRVDDVYRVIEVADNGSLRLKMVNYAYDNTGLKNLCIAGGVALNSVANGRIMREGPFESVYIQPAAGDAGGALGAALYV